MIGTILEHLGGWTWWLVGFVLLAVEVLAPGFFFLWFGIAAILIGVSALLFDWPWQLQILGFAVLSAAAAAAGRTLANYGTGAVSEDPNLNRRAARLAGRSFTLREPIVNGVGRLGIDDTYWRVEGPDLPAGAIVRVVGSEGSILRVEPAPPATPR